MGVIYPWGRACDVGKEPPEMAQVVSLYANNHKPEQSVCIDGGSSSSGMTVVVIIMLLVSSIEPRWLGSCRLSTNRDTRITFSLWKGYHIASSSTSLCGERSSANVLECAGDQFIRNLTGSGYDSRPGRNTACQYRNTKSNVHRR